MDNTYRQYIYAFLSRIMSDIPDQRFVDDLRANRVLLELLGGETLSWFDVSSTQEILEASNVDYSSMFILNTQPIESFVLDGKNETLVGLQNPVMAFYFNHGFEINMDQTALMAPDHLSLEFAFMQTLVLRNELQTQFEFMQEHLMAWVIPYMLGMQSMATTPLYRDICDFCVEFLSSEYEFLVKELKEELGNGTK